MKKHLFSLIIFITSIVFPQTRTQWEEVPDEIRNTNAFKRFEWFYRNRSDETGSFPKTHIKEQKIKELSKIKTIVKKGNRLQTTSDMWTNIGPKAIDMSSSFIPHWGAVSGRVRGLAVHPTDPNTLYIGSAAGGIWKSIDGGTNWTDMSGDLNLLTFGAIAIDPNNTNIVYAGTGESMASFNRVTFEGDGLYKSIDGGVSWTKITNGFGDQTHFADVEVSPHDSNILLAALGSGNWNLGNLSNEGVWRSTDAGITWTQVNSISDAYDVAFDPTIASTRAYATTGNQNSSGGFFVSTNSGATWSQSNTGLPSPSSLRRIQFSIAQSSPATIYAIIYPGAAIFDVYKSTNFGASWVQISPLAANADQGWYDLAIAVNPTNPDEVFYGNVELAKTSDGSTITLQTTVPGGGYWDCPIHVDIHKIVYSPSNPNTIYIGSDGGIFKSIDGGVNWTHINNNINTVQFYRIASDNNDVNKVYGGAQDNGNFSTSDKGATDWVFETSGDGMECFVDWNNSNTIFVSTQYGSLRRSTDGGINWVTEVGSNSSTTAWLAPYWQHPSNSNYIYAGWGQRIIRSTNNGANWNYLSGNITSNKLTSITQSTVNTNKMMAIASEWTTSPDMFFSTDEGASWSTLSGISGAGIHNVVAGVLDEDTYYICRASYSTGQVMKTTDFGANWTDISGNLPKVSHNDLFVDPANTSHLYVANDFGVYWSNDGGTEWNKLSNGMPFVPVLDLDLYQNGSTRLLRAASHGRGVFELQIDTPLEKIYVDLKVFLEGPYNNPIMNTDIQPNVPKFHPYNTAPWNYAGTESATITTDIVDWVLVELRTGSTPATATTVVGRKAALLKNDGTIVDSDGITNVNFNLASGNYYIVIYHRNHLPVMSATAISL
ncbi:MAG: hypothetical protein GY936_19280 [Ignavibacteriae bacterium]|nr:hypothetical protein [Ignavibacteriota bacterium]